jgi:hypothetical protein
MFFQIRHCFWVMMFLHWCHFVLLWLFDGGSVLRVHGSTDIWNAVMYSTFSALTSSHLMDRKLLKKNTLKWRLKDATKGRMCFLSFFHCKQGIQLTYYVKTNCFQFVKIENDNNKSDINVNCCNLEKVADPKKLYLHFLLQITSPATSFSIVLDLWIILYK